MNKPDDLLAKAASGTGEVDVHDVMIAMSQAELTLTVATNAVSKVIQAYDKIVQIQVQNDNAIVKIYNKLKTEQGKYGF